MEEKLKKLLQIIIKRQNSRKNKIEESRIYLERSKDRQKDAVEKFEEDFLDDVKSGIYSRMTDSQIKREIENGKRAINERYEAGQKSIESKILELTQKDKDVTDYEYQTIISVFENYRNKISEKQQDSESKLKELEKLEEQKVTTLDKLNKEIEEKEAKYTHMIMQSRNVLDVQNENVNQIMQMSSEIQDLKDQVGIISAEHDQEIETLKSDIEKSKTKIKNLNRFLGKLQLKEISVDEIYKMFSDKKENKIEQKPELKSEPVVEPEPEQESRPEPEPESKSELKSEPKLEPESEQKQELKPESKPEPKPEQKPESKPAQKPNLEQKPVSKPMQKSKVSQTSPETQNKKFTYKFSAEGIRYDGRYINPEMLLSVYQNPQYQKSINQLIQEVLGDNENVTDFIDNSDRLIYLSIISGNAKISKITNKAIIGDTEKQRLREYYKIWNNPNNREKSNMNIIYDFKGRKLFSRLFPTLEYDYKEELKNIENNAIAQRKRKNVSIRNIGLLPILKCTMKDFNEKIKNILQNLQSKKYNNEKESGKTYHQKSFRQKIKEMSKEKASSKKKSAVMQDKQKRAKKHSRDEDYERF